MPREIFASGNLSSRYLVAYGTFVASVAAAVRDEMKSPAPNAAIIYDVQEMIKFEMELEKVQIINTILNVFSAYNNYRIDYEGGLGA